MRRFKYLNTEDKEVDKFVIYNILIIKEK